MNGEQRRTDETQTAFAIRLIQAEAWAEGHRAALAGCDDTSDNPYTTSPAPTERTPDDE